MHDAYTTQLSDYLDDGLDPVERHRIDEHLRGCLDCRIVLDELRSVRDMARDLPLLMPRHELWPAIDTRLAPVRVRRRVSFSLPAAIAAGLFIALASGLGTWVIVERPAQSVPVTGDMSVPGMTSVSFRPEPYDRAIAELLATLRADRDGLSPKTIDTIERSLVVIDDAIADARAALDRDPGDVALVSYLASRQRTRLAVLRQVERLAPDAP